MILFYVFLVSDQHWRKCQKLWTRYRTDNKLIWDLDIFVIGHVFELRYRYLIVTWRDESIPPCRMVSDTSGHLCGRPLLLCPLHQSFHCGFLLWIIYNRSANPCSSSLSLGATKRNTGKSSDIVPTKKTEVLAALDTPRTGSQPRCVSDHWFGAGIIYPGSGSSILGWKPIRIQIQGFDGQKLKRIYNWKFLYIFFGSKIPIYL